MSEKSPRQLARIELRLPAELAVAVREAADRAGLSINGWVAAIVGAAVGQRVGLLSAMRRAARAGRELGRGE